MTRAFGYLRVSTERQSESGLGLEAQHTAIATTARRLGLTLAEAFTDAAVSGGLALEHRPALMAAINRLGTGDVLLVAKRDRLGRDVLNVAMITRLVQRKGARIISAAGEGSDDTSPTSVLMQQIIDAFAEYERAVIRSRVRAAMAVLKSHGKRVGHVPYGHRLAKDGVHLEPDEAEQRLVSQVQHWRRDGYTLAAIADFLNANGLRTRQGNIWQRSFVSQLLERRKE
jgi:DNA invertase Pin-like site-specific DNA recombinase